MEKIKIGWAEIDITPSKRASLQGQFAERISEYVEKPITATALAIEAGGDQAILVSVDVNGISYNLVEAIREKLKSNIFQCPSPAIKIRAIRPYFSWNRKLQLTTCYKAK